MPELVRAALGDRGVSSGTALALDAAARRGLRVGERIVCASVLDGVIYLWGSAGRLVDPGGTTAPELVVHAGDDAIETAARLRRLAIAWMLADCVRAGAIVMHAGSLLRDGQVWVVGGPSHAGKSTLLARVGRAFLNEEYAILFRRAAGDWESWYFPHARSAYEARPPIAPLAMVATLSAERGRTAARRVDEADAFARLFALTHRLDCDDESVTVDRLAALVAEVPMLEVDHCLDQPIETLLSAMQRATEGDTMVGSRP